MLQALREREPHATTAGQEPDLPASDALLVVSWAAESPDADAVKLRDEHRAGLAPLRWSRAWIFGPQVAGDRLSRAKTWEAAGRPIAGEALLAPAAQAEADARFEPWTPPRGWRWGAACYAGVCGRVDTLEKAADGGAKTTHVRHGEVIRIFDLLKAAGWSGHHPRPVRVAARPDPAQVAAELWAAARSQGQAVAQTMTDPDARRDALDGLWGARVLGAAGDRVRVEVPACLDWGWLASAVAPELLAALDLVVAAGPPGEAPAPQPAQAEHPDPIVASVLAALKRRRAEDAGTSTDAEKAPAPSTPPAPAAAGPPPARERPATRTAGGPALRLPPPEPAAEFPPVVLPDGREIHGDLTALLGIKNAHLAQALVRAHIESTQDLLVLDEQERKHTPKVGPALWRKVAAALPEGVELGCLAGRARAGEGGSQQAAPRGGGRPDYAAQMAEIREMLQRDGGQNEHEHGVIEGDWTPAGDAGGGDGAGSDRFAARDAW